MNLSIFVPKQYKRWIGNSLYRNFGAIKSASICLKDYNIFIGEQGSGKSTIAKLITIFEGIRQRIGDFQQDLLSLFEEHNIASYFNEDTYIHFTWEGGTIYYEDNRFACEVPESKEISPIANLYIPAERFFVSTFSRSIATLVLNKAPIPQTLLNFASIYEKAKNKYPNYNISILICYFRPINKRNSISERESQNNPL